MDHYQNLTHFLAAKIFSSLTVFSLVRDDLRLVTTSIGMLIQGVLSNRFNPKGYNLTHGS